MTPVQILLSTYNGSEHLPDLLASLDAQRNSPEWRIFWRDDGSTVGSAFWLEKHPRAFRLADNLGNVGPAKSFLYLLDAAPNDAAAYAFCDQDDVWQPEKLAWAWEWISIQPLDRPALYFARQQIVDTLLRPIGTSPDFRRPPGFRNALAQNIAAGCTMVMNAAARRLIVTAPPPPLGSMHDWWCYLLVSGAGGELYADRRTVILYRQHADNAIGVTPSLVRRAIGVLHRGPGAFIRLLDAHLTVLTYADHVLSDDFRRTVALLHPALNTSMFNRLCSYIRARLYRQTLLEDFVLFFFFLLTRRNLGTNRSSAIYEKSSLSE